MFPCCLSFIFPCTHCFSVPGMYPSGFDYMAPPPPYPGPPQNWTPPPQNWASAPPPPGLFSIFIFLTFCFFSPFSFLFLSVHACVTAHVRFNLFFNRTHLQDESLRSTLLEEKSRYNNIMMMLVEFCVCATSLVPE